MEFVDLGEAEADKTLAHFSIPAGLLSSFSFYFNYSRKPHGGMNFDENSVNMRVGGLPLFWSAELQGAQNTYARTAYGNSINFDVYYKVNWIYYASGQQTTLSEYFRMNVDFSFDSIVGGLDTGIETNNVNVDLFLEHLDGTQEKWNSFHTQADFPDPNMMP